MKNHLKRYLETRAPAWLRALYIILHGRRLRRRQFAALQDHTQAALYGRGEIKILSGPFRGLRYFNEISWGSVTPKWLGSYELELAPLIEEIVTRPYTHFVNLGCAEGYYAVGLAHRCPRAAILAYDIDFLSRRQTRKLARLNRLADRVHVSGRCTPADLARAITAPALILCDIEGSERTLLDPSLWPALTHSDLLVETHEGPWTPATEALLTTRFHSTHTIQKFSATPRDPWLPSFLAQHPALDPHLLRTATDEHRANGHTWLWLQATSPRS